MSQREPSVGRLSSLEGNEIWDVFGVPDGIRTRVLQGWGRIPEEVVDKKSAAGTLTLQDLQRAQIIDEDIYRVLRLALGLETGIPDSQSEFDGKSEEELIIMLREHRERVPLPEIDGDLRIHSSGALTTTALP